MGTSVRSSHSVVVRAERQPPQHKMAHDLNGKDVERAKFAFDIYDFEGKSRMDMFYLGDCLRGLNLNPTLKMIDKLGGAKKKGEKFIKLEEFYPIYSDVKKSKDTGSFEDFIECLKLYDKMENGTMMLGELEHILLSLGEKLELDQQPVRAALQLSVKTTFNYQLQLAVSTTTQTRRQNYQHQTRCGPKSPLANF